MVVPREESQAAGNSSPQKDFMVSSKDNNSNYFQSFTAHFNNEDLIRMQANPESATPDEYRFRIISNEGVTSPPQVQSPKMESPNPGDLAIAK